MNTLGKVCAGLTLLAMGGWIYLGARLGKTANDWSVKVRDAKIASEKATSDRLKAELELSSARSELARLKLGWGHEWQIAAGAVQVLQDGLQVTGLGTENGLQVRELEKSGAEPARTVAPTVHIFVSAAPDQSVYIGEFIADLNQLSTTQCLLKPTWLALPQEIAAWDFSQGARMRSLIPTGARTAMEGVNQAIERSQELLLSATSNIANQQKLLEAAEKQLENRRNELQGNPEGKEVADRPEVKAGLIQALHDSEEERNALQIQVDTLRREIKAMADARDAAIVELTELADKLPAADSQVSQK